MNDALLLIHNLINLFTESAPWLLLGLLIAGIMHELVPVDILKRHMGDASIGAIIKSAIIGAPLPLCSCGVIPAAVGLRRSGASKSATSSFLVATPETGVDSVAVSYALLGPLYAIVRPITAILSAIYTGLLVRWFAVEAKPVSTEATIEDACCNHKPSSATEKKSCCAAQPQKPDLFAKVKAVLTFSTGKLLNDIALWLLIGLGLAAAIQTWVPTDFLLQWGDGLAAMLVMAVVGIPMYICATASTPIAVGFLAAGLSPGAVLVFLMAGPATNISTMGMIAKEMGRRTLVLYLIGVISASIGFGYLLNSIVATWSLQHWINLDHGIGHHEGATQAVYALCALVLAALMARNGWRILREKMHKPTTTSCCH